MALSSLVAIGEPRGCADCREFGFCFRDPLIEFFLAHDFNRDRHEGMARAAQFGALAVIEAFLLGFEPSLVELTRDRVNLHAESRNGPGMDDVRSGGDQANSL